MLTPEELPLPGADVKFYRHFFTEQESAQYFNDLLRTTNWQQERIKLFGREVLVPRLVAWHGEADAVYTYSGVKHLPQPFTPVLLEIKARIEKTIQKRFNAALLNLYRSGTDSMGWHSDDEAELGPAPVIASVSFGAPRRFVFRQKDAPTRKPFSLILEPGSLLLMQGPTQQNWQHQLPKTTLPTEPRINVTFRLVL